MPSFNKLNVKKTRRNRTRVKICGITRAVDAEVAVEAGADALGFVFYDASPRNVSVEQAAEIIALLPAFVTTVALFVNPSAALVHEVVAVTGVDLLQFHGDESRDFAEQFVKPYLSVVKISGTLSGTLSGTTSGTTSSMNVSDKIAAHPHARGVLFDTFDKAQAGGTGKVFDWSKFDGRARGAILAGGLNAANVEQALQQTQAYAVDVSSGVERQPGIKDHDKVRHFIERCQAFDASLEK